MLSNVELIVLSLVHEKPSYAYEIEKQIETRNMRLWVKIGIASIYQVLERLNKKDFVKFEVEREGKAPERKRFFVTEAGLQELRSSVKELLGTLEWFYLDLNVAIEGSHVLEASEIRECLERRLDIVRHSLQRLRQMCENTDRTCRGDAIMRNVLGFREAEEKLLAEYLNTLFKGD